MTRKKFYITLALILIIAINNGIGQYYPVFSQYISNGLLINPGYTGSREVLSINALYRKQMIGFSGSPQYFIFSAHSTMKNPLVGLGFLFLDEKIGPIHNSHLYFHYAFRIPASEGWFSLGFKAGINYAQYNWRKIYLNDTDDPAFKESQNYLLPNFGAGIYYYTPNFFAGLSVPYFLTYKEKNNYQSMSFESNFKNYNYLISGGYLLYFSKSFKLKPTFLFKLYAQSQSQLDLNTSVILLDDKLNLTLAYRMDEAIVGSFEVHINPQLRIGYSYEYAGKVARFFNYTSHEIGIRYEFMYKIKAANPRYF